MVRRLRGKMALHIRGLGKGKGSVESGEDRARTGLICDSTGKARGSRQAEEEDGAREKGWPRGLQGSARGTIACMQGHERRRNDDGEGEDGPGENSAFRARRDDGQAECEVGAEDSGRRGSKGKSERGRSICKG